MGLKSLGLKFSLIREGRVSVGVCRMGLFPTCPAPTLGFWASGGMEKTEKFHKPSWEEEEVTEDPAGEPPKKAASVARRLSNPNKPVSRRSPPRSQEYQCKPDPKSSHVSGQDSRVPGKQRELRTTYTCYRPKHPVSPRCPGMRRCYHTHPRACRNSGGLSVPGLSHYASVVPSGTGGDW